MLTSLALIAIDPSGIPAERPPEGSTERPNCRNVPLIKPAAADLGDATIVPLVAADVGTICDTPLPSPHPLAAAFSIRRFKMSCKFNRFL